MAQSRDSFPRTTLPMKALGCWWSREVSERIPGQVARPGRALACRPTPTYPPPLFRPKEPTGRRHPGRAVAPSQVDSKCRGFYSPSCWVSFVRGREVAPGKDQTRSRTRLPKTSAEPPDSETAKLKA